MFRDRFSIETPGRGLIDVTERIEKIVQSSGLRDGFCNVFIKHTSASLIISENADPEVCRDLERFFARLVKDGDALFVHDAEGPDDMPAHIRGVLTGVSLNVPVEAGKLLLGTWQSIYLWEHRHREHTREIVVTVVGK